MTTTTRRPWADLVGAPAGTRAARPHEWRTTSGRLIATFPTRAALVGAVAALDTALAGPRGYRTHDRASGAGPGVLARVVRDHGGRLAP